MKKIKVNENCIGCGACTAIAPENFEFSDEGYAKPIKNEIEEITEDVKEAQEGCPVSAIEIEE
jgi:ferredoxin